MEGNTIGGFPIFYSKKSDKFDAFDIVLSDFENITVTAFKDLVSVEFTGATLGHFASSTGIMGSVSGATLDRDGHLMDISTADGINAFGGEWQVGADEPMLFRTYRSPQSQNGEKCLLPGSNTDSKQSLRRRLGAATVSREAAEEACAHLSGASKDACVEDVISIGDLDIASAGAY